MDRYGVRLLWDKDGGAGSGGTGGDAGAAEKAKADQAKADALKAEADAARAKAELGGDDEGKPGLYGRLAGLITQRNDANAKLAEIETAQAKAKETDLAKQNEFKALWEGEKVAHEKTKGEAKAASAKALRLEVSQAKGLPVELAARLQGDTKEALEADADALLAVVGSEHKAGPGIPPRGVKGTAKVFDLETMSAKDVRENAGKIMEQANSPTR